MCDASGKQALFSAPSATPQRARPGRIIQDKTVQFARPPTLESSYEPDFTALVQQLRMSIAHARSDADKPTVAALTPVTASRIKETLL